MSDHDRVEADVPPAFAGAALFVRPALAAATLIALLVLLPGRTRHPDAVAAEALVRQATDLPDSWVRWALGDEDPAPEEVLVRYGRPSQ